MGMPNGSEDRVADALRHAASLEVTDWAAAIAELAAENRRHRSPELETALVSLRHRSASRALAETVPDPDAMLAGGSSPGIGPSGLPETNLTSLNARDLRAAVLAHGSLLVRGALPAERAQELADEIDQCWQVSAGEVDPSAAPGGVFRQFWPPSDGEASTAGTFVHGIRNWVRAAGGVLLCDSPSIQFEILDLYREMGLHAVVTEYLGGPPVLSANKCTLRRVSPETVGGWHQDGAFLGTGIRAINLWLALSDCGRDAPGMDLVPTRISQIVETGGPGAYFDWAASDAVVEQAAGAAGIVRPEFRAGDLLIFDDLMLHRTATESSMAHDRRAVELWSFSAAAYPEGHVALVW